MAAVWRWRGGCAMALGAALALVVSLLARPGLCDDGGEDDTFCIKHHELCADTVIPYEGRYLGQDEPSLAFYSDAPGSGNYANFVLRLPKDPPWAGVRGSSTNTQLYETFWLGMAMCDTQSAPEATNVCVPDSDANVYDNPDPSAPDYIGNHPGTAYMELQFYPPGSAWSSDRTHWFSTLNIFSVGFDQNHGIANNQDCLNRIGFETINSAHIALGGLADVPAGPLSRMAGRPDPSSYLAMNPGDMVSVLMHDTPDGFQVVIHDMNTRQSGSMTASAANGFTQAVFDPSASTCSAVPYSFHPMYAGSSEHTRVPWTVHSFNVAVAAELGHSESDDSDGDENGAPDLDFDGFSYQRRWAGTATDPIADWRLHPEAIRFSSPISAPPGSVLQNYTRVAFEADLPRFESACDGWTGTGCVNPPPGARFYPIFTATLSPAFGSMWNFGGTNFRNLTQDFGGSAATEYGALLSLSYPGSAPIFSDFRDVIADNPGAVDPAALPSLHVPVAERFAPRAVGSSSGVRRISIINHQLMPVEITGIAASGDFVIDSTSCGQLLAPRSRCVVGVSFTPQSTGPVTGSLTVSDNAVNSPQIVNLSGAGK